MPEFQIPLSVPVIILPAIGSGVLLFGSVFFVYMYLRTKDDLHLSMSFLAILGCIFVFSEAMLLTVGGWKKDYVMGMQIQRVEQIAGAFFLFALPF